MTEIPSLEERTVKKVFWRLMPFLCLLYIIAFLDRVNVSYAALSMNKDLGFSNAVYGFGAGIFFIGYFVMEIPGNLIMARVGARIWIARILISWGIIAGLTALVSTPHQFYLVRFFLGVAEASFFPGIIYYLGTWCRAQDQAKAVAVFMMSLPLCNVLGAPVSTYLLGIDWLSIAGWKWLFILEAIPAVILGIMTPFYLTNHPSDAKWLTDAERNWLIDVLALEAGKKVEKKKYTLWQAFTDADVIKLAGVYFFWVCGFYGLGLFLPILVKSLSAAFSNQKVGFLVAVPYIFAFIAMFLVGRNSDRTGERRWHTVFGMITGAVGLGCSVLFAHISIFVSMVFFTLSVMGIYASFGPFWAIPHSFLTATAAAGAIAMINSVGNFGGFVGPYAMGYIHDATGSFNGGLLFLVGCLLAAAVLLIMLGKSGRNMK
ncbi:MAG: putative tartrate transporter [Smithella sp. PtaU1.Bin162]|nr:MAG: putative tartrate transporter [Smithella sp. PtaU1.Bin162]